MTEDEVILVARLTRPRPVASIRSLLHAIEMTLDGGGIRLGDLQKLSKEVRAVVKRIDERVEAIEDEACC